MKKDILKRVREKTIIYDGAMGTMLMAAGLPPGKTPEIWNMENPKVISDIHRLYYAAGSDVVQTNTFGGNPLKLGEQGLAESMESLNTAAAKIACEACPEDKFVAGDMGPSGKMLKPLGDTAPEEAPARNYDSDGRLLQVNASTARRFATATPAGSWSRCGTTAARAPVTPMTHGAGWPVSKPRNTGR